MRVWVGLYFLTYNPQGIASNVGVGGGYPQRTSPTYQEISLPEQKLPLHLCAVSLIDTFCGTIQPLGCRLEHA